MNTHGLNIWTGWIPGESGCWCITPEQAMAEHPELFTTRESKP